MDFRSMVGLVRAVHGLKVRSALNPGLWLVVFGALFPLGFAICFKDIPVIMYTLFILAVVVISGVLIAFLYFSFCHPDKLQSEEYQLRHQAMQIYQNKADVIEPTENGLLGITNSRDKEGTK